MGNNSVISLHRPILIFIVLWFSFILPQTSFGQETDGISVIAEVDRDSLSLDDQLALTITIQGVFDDYREPVIPEWDDFVQTGYRSFSSTSIENGLTTSERQFIYYLQPQIEGQLLIGSVQLEIAGQLYQTEPIEITVTPANSNDLNLEESTPPDELITPPPAFIVEAEIDNLTPYLGEQVIYTFRLYRSTIFPGQPDYESPSFTDFWSQTILSQPHYARMISNTNYSVIEVRTAIFPATLGEVTIEPAKLTVPGGLRADRTLETNSITLNILSLPKDAPDSFKGAVGQFDIRATIDQNMGRVNEPLTLVVDIEGFGNIDVLNEPVLPDLSEWRILDSKPLSQLDIQEEGVYGIRRFERLIFPTQAGEFVFPSVEFSYYNPKLEEYVTLKTALIPLVIEPAETEYEVYPAVVTERDIAPLKPVPVSLSTTPTTRVMGNPLFWLCGLFPLLLIGGAWKLQRYRQHRAETNMALKQNRVAYQTAQKALQELITRPDKGHSVLHKIVLTYLSTRIDQPLTGITLSEQLARLEQAGIEVGMLTRIETLFKQIDVGRFTPGQTVVPTSQIHAAQTLIHDLERMFSQ
ncbi:BatD family protein [Anaerolineales bacterium HSG6]|nr:BatD family protein [Anaerolineales bacterium HSG6]